MARKEEGVAAAVGLILLGVVAVGVAWTALTGQLMHWVAVALAAYAVIKAGQAISRRD